MSRPSLTAILPNYNHAKYLPTAFNGLLDKGRQPDEIVVIDDGSTDNSWEIIQGYAAQHSCIQAYRNEKNMGTVFTISRALELARGDYIFASAADDCVLPGFFQKSMELLGRYPNAGLCCTIGDWREVATGLNWHVGVGMADTPSYLSPKRMVELERQGRLSIPSHSAIMRRSALVEAGNFFSELKSASDWFTIYVMAFRYGICFVPEPLAVAYIHTESYYKRTRRDQKGYREALERLMELLNQAQYQDSAELIRQGGSLYIHGLPMLKVLLSRPEYRRFLNLPFLRKCLWHSTKIFLKRFTPAPLGNLYFKISGYRVRKPRPAAADGN